MLGCTRGKNSAKVVDITKKCLPRKTSAAESAAWFKVWLKLMCTWWPSKSSKVLQVASTSAILNHSNLWPCGESPIPLHFLFHLAYGHIIMHLKVSQTKPWLQNAGSHKIKSAIGKIKIGIKMLPLSKLLTARPGLTCAAPWSSYAALCCIIHGSVKTFQKGNGHHHK